MDNVGGESIFPFAEKILNQTMVILYPTHGRHRVAAALESGDEFLLESPDSAALFLIYQ